MEVLKRLLEEVAKILDQERERARTMDTRLISIAGMVPVAVTLLLAVITFLSSGRAQDFTPISVLVLSMLCFYIGLQLVRGLLAAVAGLTRRPYAAAKPESLLEATSSDAAYLRHLARQRLPWIAQYRWANDRKVDHLIVAQRAVQNAAFGLLAGIAAVAAVVLSQFRSP